MKGKFILAGAFAFAALSVNAQSDYKSRIGHGQDSIDVVNAIQIYQEAYKAKNYAEAYEPLKTIVSKAPTALVKIYKNGQVILENLIVKETDATKKKQYYDDLMSLYDTRLKHMDELNAIAKTDKDKSSRGGIICRKAYDAYYMMDGNKYTPQYTSMEDAYKMFKDGIEDTGTDTEGFVLYGFIKLSNERFVSDQNNSQYREDFINDYVTTTDICDRLLEQANDYPTSTEVDSTGDTIVVLDQRAQKIIDQYQGTEYTAQDLFVSSGAADCNALAKIYGAQLEANKTNEAYLISLLKTLKNSDCDESEIYAKASDYAYALHPTSESAMGKASKALKAGNTNEAIKYLNEALASANASQKNKITQSIAVLLYKRGSYGEAMTWINKLPSNGQMQLLKASIVARSGNHKSIEGTYPYCLAIDICNHAKSVDPSCSGKANKQIANYTANLYPKSEAFMAGIKAGTRVSCKYGSTTLRLR